MAEGGCYEIPDELLKSLDCPICKERFKNPKIVDCTHVFCLDCLQDLIEQDGRNFPPCPVCRRPINVPEKGASAYQTQTLYVDLIHLVETQAQGLFDCRSCGETISRDHSDRCRNCKDLVCIKCIQERKHNCRKGSGSNFGASSNLARRPSKCQQHCNEKLEYYCVQCQTALCKQCRDADHLDHEIQSLHSAGIKAKKELLTVREKLEEYIGETKDSHEDLQSFMNDFSEKATFTKNQIKSEFDNIKKCINEKEVKLLREVHDIEVKTKKRFETEVEEIQTKDVRAKTLDELANNIVKYGSDSEAVLFEKSISCNWNKLNDEALHRYGKGYRLDLDFRLKEKVSELLNGEIGTLTASQHLSPWPKRKHLDLLSQEDICLDQKHLELKVGDPNWQLFPSKRSKVFANMVDAHYRFGASKICPNTGKIATAWIRTKSVERSPSSITGKISHQFGSRPSSADKTTPTKSCNSCLEVAVFNDKEEEPHVVTLDNIPDTTEVRLAVNDDGRVQIALYPGSAVLNESKKRGSFKRLSNDDDCIYIATVREIRDSLDEGDLRKVDILTYIQDNHCKSILFELTRKGYLAVHHPSFPMVFVYCPSGEKRATKLASKETEIVGICEANQDGILVVSSCKGLGSLTCEEYSLECALKYSFCVQSSITSNTLAPVFKTACYDTSGNVVLHFRKDGQDHLSLMLPSERKEEILCKPEMFHRVDQMAILPHGRICLFDKTECVLMTLQYLQ